MIAVLSNVRECKQHTLDFFEKSVIDYLVASRHAHSRVKVFNQ